MIKIYLNVFSTFIFTFTIREKFGIVEGKNRESTQSERGKKVRNKLVHEFDNGHRAGTITIPR